MRWWHSARYALEMHHWRKRGFDSECRCDERDGRLRMGAVDWAARSGNAAQARSDIEHIDAIHKTLLAKKKKGPAEAVEQDRKEAARGSITRSRNDAAIAALRAIAEKQEASEMNRLRNTGREMLADMLLEMKHADEALAEYKTSLKSFPNRFDSLYGAAQRGDAGFASQATEYYATLVKTCDGGSSTRPELARAKQAVVAEK